MEDGRRVDVPMLYAAMASAFSLDANVRNAAECSLKGWEADAVPGFLLALLNILEQHHDESLRLMAAVVAKNAVGSSWRKTLGTREWSRVPEDEKNTVRAAALRLLFTEGSARVATQLGLLTTNIARFDFPRSWPSLLTDLTQAASWEAPTSFAGKERALFTLKNIAGSLRGRRFIVEAPKLDGPMSAADLKPYQDQIAEERRLMYAQAEAVFPLIAEAWRHHFQAAAQGAPQWEARGRLANRCLFVLRELMHVLPDWDAVRPAVAQFLEAVHQGSAATVTLLAQGNGGGFENGVDVRVALAAKAFERMLQCVIATMDRHIINFANFLPAFLQLYGHAALSAMSAADLQRVRPKTRVLLVRFTSRALICPVYNRNWLDARIRSSSTPEEKERLAKVSTAVEALDGLLSAEQCPQLVEAIVTKYIALSPEELHEWQADPEGFVRSADVESSPDADTPRPCGLALLICMLDRNPNTVAAALVGLAAKLQAQPLLPDLVLAREACYRAIGEAFLNDAVAKQVNFPAWYQSELAELLKGAGGQHQQQHQLGNGQLSLVSGQVQRNLLTARAAWLVGVCGGDLPPAIWADALRTVIAHVSDGDLVLALTAVSASMRLCTSLLEEQQAIEEAQNTKRNGHDMRIAMMFLGGKRPSDADSPENIKAHEARMQALEDSAGTLFAAIFALLGRLEEIESKVRLLQLVSICVEVLGEAAQPHLGAVAAALPQVWSATAEAAFADSESGAIARMHSALIAVLTHVVTRLGPAALSNPQFQGVLWPLLEHALDVSGDESETLVEEALRLLTAVLASCPDFLPQLPALLPALVRVLHRGKDNSALFGVLEAYLLLGGPEQLLPIQAAIVAGLQKSMSALASELATATGPPQSTQDPGKAGRLSPEGLQEALAASSLITVLVQLMGDAALQALEPILRTMAAAVSTPVMAANDAPQRLVTVSEGLLEVLGRVLLTRPSALPALLSTSNDTHARFFDTWIAMASAKYLEEVLGMPATATMGRMRRRVSAAAFCQFICCGVSPALADLRRLGRALAVVVRSLEESEAFQEDRDDIQSSIHEMQSAAAARGAAWQPELGSGQVLLLRRAVLAESGPITGFDLRAALAAAFRAACALHPEALLFEAVGWADNHMEAALRKLLAPAS